MSNFKTRKKIKRLRDSNYNLIISDNDTDFVNTVCEFQNENIMPDITGKNMCYKIPISF